MKRVYLSVCILWSSLSVHAAEQLPIKFIGGAAGVQCVIHSRGGSVKAHVLIDLGQTRPLLVSRDMVPLLGLEDSDRLTLVFEGATLEALEFTPADIDGLDEFSRTNAAALDEIPVWGILGSGAFDSEVIRLDLQNQTLDYGSLEIPPGNELPLSADGLRYLFPIEPVGGYRVSGMFTTTDYESVFDSDCAALAGSESADFDNCRLGSVNVRAYTALRVRDGYRRALKKAECMIGTGFWQNFVLTLDRSAPRLVFTPAAANVISDLAEQEYFNALAEEDEAKVAAYVDKYPNSRLRDEACRYLLDAAIESGDMSAIERSVDRFVWRLEPKQAAEALLSCAQRSMQQKDLSTARLFLERAKNQALKTQDAPLLAGRIRSSLGWVALEQKDWPQAQRHLFSALLTSPDDPLANCLMGHYHRQQGQPVRAWARYLRAALADKPSSEAVAALQKIQQEPGFDGLIDIEDACDFLEGHIFAEKNQLTDSAKLLKYRCGGLVRSAIEKLQEQAR
jgi:tetratricopeptide (TPR) repeat protein